MSSLNTNVPTPTCTLDGTTALVMLKLSNEDTTGGLNPTETAIPFNHTD